MKAGTKPAGLLLVLMLCLLLAGCKPSAESPVPSQTPQPSAEPTQQATATPQPSPLPTPQQAGTVRVLIAGIELEDHIDQQTGREREGLVNMVSRLFTKNGHEDIRVELASLSFSGMEDALRTALTEKTADLVIFSGLHTGAYYADGLLRGIDDLLEQDKSFDPYSLYIDGLFDTSRVMDYAQTTHVALPLTASQNYIMQDAVLFTQWGEELLPEAPTPQQILDKARAMTGPNPVTGAPNYGLYFDPNDPNGATLIALLSYYHAQSGSGSMADPSDMQMLINTPEFKRALSWMNEAVLYMPPGIADGTAISKKMQTDNDVAIYLDANGVSEMVRYLASLEGTWISRDRPVMNMGRNGAGFINFDVIAMARGVKDEQAAWEVMKFFSGGLAQQWLYEQYGYAPTVADQEFLLPVDDYARINAQVLEVSRPDARFDPQNAFFREHILPYVSGYVTDRARGAARNVDTDLARLQQKAQDWIASFK